MSQETLDNISSKCTSLKSSIKNMRKSLDKIKEDINDSSSSNKSSSKYTNHELGTTDAPLDSEVEGYRHIQVENLNNLKRFFGNAKSEVSDLDSIIDNINTDVIEMSSDLTDVSARISHIKDDFTFLTARDMNESKVVEYIEYRNNNIDKNENKDELEQMIEDNQNMIDNILKSIKDLNNLVESISVDDVRDQVEETRRERAKHEMEQMKPFMDLNRVEELCKLGETISARDFADRLSDNSKHIDDYSVDSAEEILDNAVDASSPDSNLSVNVEKKGNKYKIE